MAVVNEARGEARYVVREAREEWPCCSQFGYGSGRRVCEAASWQEAFFAELESELHFLVTMRAKWEEEHEEVEEEEPKDETEIQVVLPPSTIIDVVSHLIPMFVF
ncbi:unnamed protein product [Prunus armeniaca]|uniref:Uncharacterized protein n=1 Tax=Prunus armeniaca TaxID=36596 RepID=A0A6J5V1A8_PRUAR|nr:hypothetical protein GBA52_020896 [Prunus armeniaca]CAB4282700.1 unnamed protein product [Prunus armeniaca]CAB4313239.1 unnamed protein product [Prunus armeniaca]